MFSVLYKLSLFKIVKGGVQPNPPSFWLRVWESFSNCFSIIIQSTVKDCIAIISGVSPTRQNINGVLVDEMPAVVLDLQKLFP